METCSASVWRLHQNLMKYDVATYYDNAQVVAVGVNCTAPRFVTGLLRGLPESLLVNKPLIVYPNSGESWNSSAHQWVEVHQLEVVSNYSRVKKSLVLEIKCIHGWMLVQRLLVVAVEQLQRT